MKFISLKFNVLYLVLIIYSSFLFVGSVKAEQVIIKASQCICKGQVASEPSSACTAAIRWPPINLPTYNMIAIAVFEHQLSIAVRNNKCAENYKSEIIKDWLNRYYGPLVKYEDAIAGVGNIKDFNRDNCGRVNFWGTISEEKHKISWSFRCTLKEEIETLEYDCDEKRFIDVCTGLKNLVLVGQDKVYKDCVELQVHQCKIEIGELCIDGTKPSEVGGCSKLEESVKSLNQLNLGKGSMTEKIQNLIGKTIKYLLSFTGSIALAMFVGGGLMWMMSRGNSERTTKALKMMTWSALGVVVILSSYVILQFIFNTFN